MPDYFNYPSTDLAKSLLSFSNPGHFTKDDTTAMDYFKSYGAILFDSNLGKKSPSNSTRTNSLIIKTSKV